MKLNSLVIKPYKLDMYVSCSGGVDSMSLLHFMRRYNNVEVIHINHNTGNFANASQELVETYCRSNGIVCHTYTLEQQYTKEVKWRDYRYSVYSNHAHLPICQGHTLDDQVEQYIMSSLKGSARRIPYKRENVIRPFLNIKKSKLYQYAKEYNVPFIEDPTNFESDNQRSMVRNKLVPLAFELNPGLYKTVRNWAGLTHNIERSGL